MMIVTLLRNDEDLEWFPPWTSVNMVSTIFDTARFKGKCLQLELFQLEGSQLILLDSKVCPSIPYSVCQTHQSSAGAKWRMSSRKSTQALPLNYRLC